MLIYKIIAASDLYKEMMESRLSPDFEIEKFSINVCCSGGVPPKVSTGEYIVFSRAIKQVIRDSEYLMQMSFLEVRSILSKLSSNYAQYNASLENDIVLSKAKGQALPIGGNELTPAHEVHIRTILKLEKDLQSRMRYLDAFVLNEERYESTEIKEIVQKAKENMTPFQSFEEIGTGLPLFTESLIESILSLENLENSEVQKDLTLLENVFSNASKDLPEELNEMFLHFSGMDHAVAAINKKISTNKNVESEA